jgi:amidase
MRLFDDIKPFDLVEASITDMQEALESRKITTRKMVQMYLDRIEKYDKQGSALNAIITVNPQALNTADEMDAERASKGSRGLLHGIPIIVKDNFDTFDLATTGGSLSLEGSIPPDDSFMVKKLREAGAIVLAKSNTAEFAFSPYETVSSLGGITRNPYALDRVPAGSSGGTAAAVAANFGAAGLGTDTGNSIRGPSSHTSLVGIRPTIGLTSRNGIIPLDLGLDVGGPMARTVTDAAILLDAVSGYDPNDLVTASSIGNKPESYLNYLKKDGLNGARIGVLREFIDTPETDPEVLKLMEQAIADLKKKGATIIDPIVIPNLEAIRTKASGGNPFKFDLNDYLKSLGPNSKMRSLDDIIASGKFDPSIKDRLLSSQKAEFAPQDDPAYRDAEFHRQKYRMAVLKVMADYNVDAIIYPSWNNPPRLIGDLHSPHGNNSPLMSPPTGFPALTVPMGFIYGQYPSGLQILGRPYSEGTLIQYAYAYEQSTKHRKSPSLTP